MHDRIGAIGWRRPAALLGALALVGVIGAGTVLAQSPADPTPTPSPSITTPAHPAVQAPILRRLLAERVRWIRAAEYATVTLKTKNGDETFQYVRGDVTSVGNEQVVVTAADGTAFTIDVTSATRIRTFRRALAFADLQDGQHAIVLAQDSGGTYTGRVILAWPAKPGAATTTTASPAS